MLATRILPSLLEFKIAHRTWLCIFYVVAAQNNNILFLWPPILYIVDSKGDIVVDLLEDVGEDGFVERKLREMKTPKMYRWARIWISAVDYLDGYYVEILERQGGLDFQVAAEQQRAASH